MYNVECIHLVILQCKLLILLKYTVCAVKYANYSAAILSPLRHHLETSRYNVVTVTYLANALLTYYNFFFHLAPSDSLGITFLIFWLQIEKNVFFFMAIGHNESTDYV